MAGEPNPTDCSLPALSGFEICRLQIPSHRGTPKKPIHPCRWNKILKHRARKVSCSCHGINHSRSTHDGQNMTRCCKPLLQPHNPTSTIPAPSPALCRLPVLQVNSKAGNFPVPRLSRCRNSPMTHGPTSFPACVTSHAAFSSH